MNGDLNPYVQSLCILLLFFIAHLLIGAALLNRSARRPLLWVVFETAAAEVARRLNRETRSQQDRLMRGFVVVILLLFFALLLGLFVTYLGQLPFGWMGDVVFLSLTMAAMTPIAVLRRAGYYLAEKKPARAMQVVQYHLAEDISGADAHAVVRKALEYAAVSTNVLLVGPALFYGGFGPAGVMFYVAVMAMHRAFGRTEKSTVYFGGTVRSLELLVNWLPARVTALLIALASGAVSRANPLAALKVAAGQAKGAESQNRGWVIGAMAGALGAVLGGPRRWENGAATTESWIGPATATAKQEPLALKRGALLVFVVYSLVMAIAALALGLLIRFT